MRLWSPLVKVCTSRLSNLMQILAALTTDVRFGKFVYRGFLWVSQASISTRPMDCYCFAPNQTFFKCLIYSDLLKKLKILSTFIWISTGNWNLLDYYSSFLLGRKIINAVWMIEMTMEIAVKTRVWFHGKWSTNEASSHAMMLTTRKVSIPFSSFFCPIESFITSISIYRRQS